MRLMPPEWRTAWYEEGLSERFVQELSRLEKTSIHGLHTSAEWVEQLVIELGQLTQNMIHLEGELPRPHQLKLAFERALKLAALSAHLMAALDQAMDHGPSVLRYSEAGGDSAPSAGAAYGAPNPLPPQVPPHLNPPSLVPVQGMPSDSRAHGEMTAQAPTAQANSSASPAAPVLRASAQTQVGVMRQASPTAKPAPHAVDPRTAARASKAPKAEPLVSNLMEISQQMIEPSSASPMREMILALSRRGMSRSEIEVITEQPRHIIEAVLQHG